MLLRLSNTVPSNVGPQPQAVAPRHAARRLVPPQAIAKPRALHDGWEVVRGKPRATPLLLPPPRRGGITPIFETNPAGLAWCFTALQRQLRTTTPRLSYVQWFDSLAVCQRQARQHGLDTEAWTRLAQHGVQQYVLPDLAEDASLWGTGGLSGIVPTLAAIQRAGFGADASCRASGAVLGALRDQVKAQANAQEAALRASLHEPSWLVAQTRLPAAAAELAALYAVVDWQELNFGMLEETGMQLARAYSQQTEAALQRDAPLNALVTYQQACTWFNQRPALPAWPLLLPWKKALTERLPIIAWTAKLEQKVDWRYDSQHHQQQLRACVNFMRNLDTATTTHDIAQLLHGSVQLHLDTMYARLQTPPSAAALGSASAATQTGENLTSLFDALALGYDAHHRGASLQQLQSMPKALLTGLQAHAAWTASQATLPTALSNYQNAARCALYVNVGQPKPPCETLTLIGKNLLARWQNHTQARCHAAPTLAIVRAPATNPWAVSTYPRGDHPSWIVSFFEAQAFAETLAQNAL